MHGVTAEQIVVARVAQRRLIVHFAAVVARETRRLRVGAALDEMPSDDPRLLPIRQIVDAEGRVLIAGHDAALRQGRGRGERGRTAQGRALCGSDYDCAGWARTVPESPSCCPRWSDGE